MRTIDFKELEKKINEESKKMQEVEKLMFHAMKSDVVCQFILGLTDDEWKNLTQKKRESNTKMRISEELNDCDCSVTRIHSLPLNSIEQIKAIQKLKKIVEYFSPVASNF